MRFSTLDALVDDALDEGDGDGPALLDPLVDGAQDVGDHRFEALVASVVPGVNCKTVDL